MGPPEPRLLASVCVERPNRGLVRLLVGGPSHKEIAAQLSLTEETVKSHIRNILAKLGANDRTHAVAIGLKRGIIDL